MTGEIVSAIEARLVQAEYDGDTSKSVADLRALEPQRDRALLQAVGAVGHFDNTKAMLDALKALKRPRNEAFHDYFRDMLLGQSASQLSAILLDACRAVEENELQKAARAGHDAETYAQVQALEAADRESQERNVRQLKHVIKRLSKDRPLFPQAR